MVSMRIEFPCSYFYNLVMDKPINLAVKTFVQLPPVRRKQLGFSLIEVLISVLILSVGMLGAVGMQATAMKSNKETRNQSLGINFARELGERMRGNHTVAIKSASADNPYLFDVTLEASTTIASPAVNCFTDGCSAPKDAATWDVADWQGRVQAALPTPRVKVCFDNAPFDASGLGKWDCTDSGDVAVLKMGWTRSNTAGTLEFAGSSGAPVVIIPLTAGSQE